MKSPEKNHAKEGDAQNLQTEDSPLELHEGQKLNPEQVTQEEEKRLGGILQKLGDKTKTHTAAALFMVMTSGVFAGFHQGASAQEKKRGNTPTVQTEKERDQREFLIQKEGFSFTVTFSENAKRIMERQKIRFQKETGAVWLNETAPMPSDQPSAFIHGVAVIEQNMIDGVSTQSVEIIGEELILPGDFGKKELLKITVRNSDGSVEKFTLVDGRVVNYTK